MPLGVNLTSLTKVLKCAKDDDVVILKAADDADILSLTYEARSTCLLSLRLPSTVRIAALCLTSARLCTMQTPTASRSTRSS